MGEHDPQPSSPAQDAPASGGSGSGRCGLQVVPTPVLQPHHGQATGSGAVVQQVAVARCRRETAPAAPDQPGCDITGRYQEVEGLFLIHINQAGTHIHCWISRSLTAADSGAHLVTELSGDLQAGSRNFTLTLFGQPGTARGTLRVPQSGSDLTLQGFSLSGVPRQATYRLVRNSTGVTLSDDALSRLPFAATGPQRDSDRLYNRILCADQRYPMTRQYMTWLRTRLSPARIQPRLQRFFDAPSTGIPTQRFRFARELDDYIGTVFSTNRADGDNAWHREDIDSARFYGKLMLAGQRWTHSSVTRSHLDWIQLMLNNVRTSPNGATLRPFSHIATNLGLTPANNAQTPRYRYNVEILVGGLGGDVGVGLGGFLGTMTVRAFQSGGSQQRWQQNYLVWIAMASVGVDTGVRVGMRMTGTGHSVHPWAPPEIPGRIAIVAGESVHGGVGIGAEAGQSVLMIYGNGTHPALAVDLSGPSIISEIGAGVDFFGTSWGYAHATGASSWDSERRGERFVRPDSDRDYVIDANVQDRTHFLFCDAFLTDEGRQAVRSFCAIELKGLNSGSSRLTIHGHTDRVGTDQRNMALSRLRATNAYQAILDILQNDMAIPANRVHLIPHGESEASQAHEPPRLRNPQRRRVDIVLNSRFTTSLRGGGPPGGTAASG